MSFPSLTGLRHRTAKTQTNRNDLFEIHHRVNQFEESELPMRAHHPQTKSFQDLRDYVYQTLCHHEMLEVGVFPMTVKLLRRRAIPCGIYFCLHGPRSVKFTAIWDSERNTVLFYGATGERFMKMQLAVAPAIEAVTA